MNAESEGRPGPVEREGEPSGNARGIAARVFQLVCTRFELFALELDEERRGVVGLLLFLMTGAVLSLLAIVFLTSAGILALEPAWRPWGAAFAGLIYAGVATWSFLRVRKLLRDRSAPFSATVAELKRDREWFQNLK